MNWWIIFITFLAVNLDFFFILIFLLERYNLRDVIIGYLGSPSCSGYHQLFARKNTRYFPPRMDFRNTGDLANLHGSP